MKYEVYASCVKQEDRAEFNHKLLYLIDSGQTEQYEIKPQDVYNAYTGDGGLHGLKREDFANYSKYSEAKKEIENGQFFTPPELCRLVTEALAPKPDELIGDLTCGAGGFFNFLPCESNLYGCEIDAKAFKVARFLYPNANLENRDIRTYHPNVRFDLVVGNPPFNLKWWISEEEEMKSQLYYCIKAGELLKPLGIMAVITPKSFLSDDLLDGAAIKKMEDRFSFLGQVSLPDAAFHRMGVTSFETKLQFWQKKSDEQGCGQPYSNEIAFALQKDFDVEKAANRIHETLLKEARKASKRNKYSITRQLAKEKALSSDFQYRVEKMLYQIKCHPRLREQYTKCYEFYYRFLTEKQPENMDYKEWSRARLTEAKVTAYLRHVLKKQSAKQSEDRIALVKRKYDFVYKGYSGKARKMLTEEQKTPVPIYRIASGDDFGTYPGYEKLIRRKQKEYVTQNQQFSAMKEDAVITEWLKNFMLWDEENDEVVCLNDIQRHDLNLILQKKYGLLQWEQGSGKTLAGIAAGMYRMQKQHFFCTLVTSTAISIRNNWDVVLPNYGLSYVFVEKLADLEKIKQGDFAIITLNKLGTYRKQVKKWVKRHNQKVFFLFDESDEMTNPSSIRAKSVLDCFRCCKAKLLTTGTSTRNNISEFAPQLELLYNNSVNMLSWCRKIYHYDKESEELEGEDNDFFGQPIPAYKKGYRLFANSHLPEKITVFGIEQRTQDIYNANELNELLGKTVITRTFEEVTGKEIRRIHQVPVEFSPAEKAVYAMAMEEFESMRRNYFTLSDNARKDAMMKLIQQITLLLRIGAAPDTVMEYDGDTPVKIQKVVQMAGMFSDETVAIGVRHKVVLDSYKSALEAVYPDRKIFVVTGSSMSFAQRRALRKTLKESGNGILLCTQQSLPSSVNFEYVNKIIIPELHFNNARMSQFYMRFIRYTSTEWKDIYFVTYAGSIESNLMQMVLAKEKINLFMKGQDTNLDEVYEHFGVDYDLMSLLMRRVQDEEGHFHIRWGEQKIA